MKVVEKERTGAVGSMRQAVYSQFKNALFSGRIRPGEFLSQREICELLGAPLGPVREALKALEAEGIVTLLSKRGVRVIQIDREALSDAYRAREVIEGEAAKVFAEAGPEATIGELKKRTDAFTEKFRSQSGLDEAIFQEKAEVDFLLHDTLMDFLDSPILKTAFDRATEHVRIFRMNIAASQHFFELPAMEEHQAIIAALEARDGELARERMQLHLRGAFRRAVP